jgi:GNAT superfamily N-acetyltransferase
MMDDGSPTLNNSLEDVVRIRACQIDEIGLLGPIDLSANPLFAKFGHPEFADDDGYDSVPHEVAVAAIHDGRLLCCDLLRPDGSSNLVGWVVMFDRPNGDTSIGQISVHADHMGNGYGGPLLLAVIDRCRSVKRRSIVLNTQTDIPWNRPWYERFGFVVVPPAEWDADMHEAIKEQTESGLNWATRVHMRLVLE